MSKLSRVVGAAKLALHAKAPTILVVSGVISMGGAAILACRATMKIEDTLEPFQEQLDTMKNGVIKSDEAQAAKVQMSLEVGKLYLAPLGLFLLGAGMTFKGHSILQQRNAALAMAFTTLKKAMDAYRQRVITEQGHEADQRYMSGSTTVTTNKNGTIVQSQTRDWSESATSPYARIFSNESSDQWVNDLGSNKHFVSSQQRFAQQLLNHQGYLYLSDVYKSLGLAENDTSRVCGWRITTMADGTRNVPIVDFGIDKPLEDDWKYNQNKAIFLDFNCQGLILGGKIQKAIEAAAA
jgi:hypothetical protein